MVRTLKWIYDLGVRHERERIAAVLRIEQGRIHNRREDIFTQLGQTPAKPTPKDKRVELEVNERVDMLIQNIFHSEQQIVQGNSIMFPDGKER